MYDELRENVVYSMLYAGVMVLAMTACCYLLFRQGNAFARHVTPPARLRRCTAAFFAVFVLNHAWYMLPIFFLTSDEDIAMTNLVGGLLDCITFFPLAIVVMLTMLQDRRRSLWPALVMTAPPIAGMVWSIASHNRGLIPMLCVYLLLMSFGFLIYMVREVRQYGRWLRDNYADLEHKEVWQSFVVLAIMLLVFVVYTFTDNAVVYEYVLQVMVAVLIGYLLWRVETLSDLSLSQSLDLPVDLADECARRDASQHDLADNIGLLLQQYCIDTQLYLQHDLTIHQLAKAIGTNRFYLSQYFSSKGMNYNTYVNDLRISHFVSLYREAVTARSPFTVQQLADKSGYRSYSTFNLAFKQRMGQSVKVWARLQNQQ